MKKNIIAAIFAVFAMTTGMNAKSTTDNMMAISPIVENQTAYIYNNVSNKDSKVVFSKDDQGRVTSKVILHMNNGEWVPVGAYSIFYGETENIVTYAGWDSKTKTFTKSPSQQSFDATKYPVVMTMPE